MRTQWPEDIYDYEREEIVDGEVEDLDLEDGSWIRCQRCGVQKRMQTPYGIAVWNAHKKTKAHQHALERTDLTSRSTEDPPRYADFAAAMMENIEKDTDYLVFYRQELQKRAKEQVQAKKLVQSMAMLVTEQQEDVETLRDVVDDLKQDIKELREEMKALRKRNKIVTESLSSENNDSPAPCFIEIVDSDDEMSPAKLPAPRASHHSNGDATSHQEMDMFDEDIQFMQLD